MKKEEGRGEKAHMNPNPGRQKSKQRKAEQATKQKPSSETIEAGQQREGTTTEGMGREEWEERWGKKTKKEGEGRGVSQVMHAASMDPPGIPKYPGSHQERGERGLCEVGMIYFLLFIKHSRPYGPFLSCGVFHSLVTFPNAYNLYTAAWKPIPTRTGSCHKNSNVLRYPILHIERTNGTHKSVRLCPLTLLLIEWINYSEMDLSDDDNVDALSLPRSNPDKAQSWQSEHFNKLYVWCGQIDQIRVVRYDVLSGSKA